MMRLIMFAVYSGLIYLVVTTDRFVLTAKTILSSIERKNLARFLI